MAGKQEIGSILILGTAGMLFLAILVVVFVVIYQRRMYDKEDKIKRLEIERQSEFIEIQEKLIDAEIKAAEREQKRIAQDLHDDIGASLSSFRFLISQLSDDEEVKPAMKETLTHTTQKVRQLCNDLLPYVLEELGFEEAIVHLIKEMNKTAPVEIGMIQLKSNSTDIILTKEVQLSLYRIVQEIIHNIIKYAEATYIDVQLVVNEKEVNIGILDDGNGIIPVINENTRSLGLKNIQSRLQFIKGEMTREAAVPRGTIVEIKKELV